LERHNSCGSTQRRPYLYRAKLVFFTNERKSEYLKESPTPYTCPWKGVCQYFSVGKDDQWSQDSAFSYPPPKESAIEVVKKDFSNYVTFWRDVQVVEE